MASILVVDDDPILLALAEEILSSAGHVVFVAGDGKAGLGALQQGRFDLVVTDVLMPELDGLELIGRLRASGSKLKILAVSGGGAYASRDVLEWAKAAGADRAFAKPLRREAFLEAVEALLAPPPPTLEAQGDA